MKIAYLKHPLDADRKAEFQAKGFKIIDVRYAPEKVGADDHVDGRTKRKRKGS